MPIPKPITGESREGFMDRCVSFLLDEGRPQDQANAICISQYENKDEWEESQKYVAWKTIDRQRESFLNYARNVFYRALRVQMKQFLDEVEKQQSYNISPVGIIEEEPIREAYLKLYTKIVPFFAKQSYNQLTSVLKKSITPDWNAMVQRWMGNNSASLISGITSKGVMVMEKQIETALAEGWSIQKFGTEVGKTHGFGRKRAELIGRTEIIRASNFGSLEGAIESGVPATKSWLSTRDGRTRSYAKGDKYDHVIMDGKTVQNLRDPFLVNGQPMKFPADSSMGASPGNTINCRCTITYKPIEPDYG